MSSDRDPTALTRGQLLGRRFRLIRQLGEGLRGEVWLAEDRELEDRVVVKIAGDDDASGSSETALELLRRECRHARRLVHPNIVSVFDFHHDGQRGFVTMAYVEGESIGCLRGRPLEEIVPPLAAIADALAYAHGEGIVHRDLKASNVLVDARGKPHILDFGIAGLIHTQGREPGRANAPSPADDIFAFAMLARDLTGAHEIPQRLDALFSAMANRDPRSRPESMGFVCDELRAVQKALGPVRPASRAVRPPPRVIPPKESASFGAAQTPATSRARPAGRGAGAGTFAAFAALLSLAGVVFFLLPRWVGPVDPASVVKKRVPTPAAPAIEGAAREATIPFQELAEAKARAEKARELAARLRDRLEARGARAWGGSAYRTGLDAMAEGDERLGRRELLAAEQAFEKAVQAWNAVAERAKEVAGEALQKGRDALAAGRASEAREAFTLAGRIEPGSAAARRGLARARVFDEVTALVGRGEELEARGRLEEAAATYRKAAALDPQARAAQRGLARVDARARERAFSQAMSVAVAALNAGDLERSRRAFETARTLRPEAPGVASGLEALAEAEKRAAIAEHRSRAAAFEREEAWRAAEKEFEAVLALDPTIRFAQDGKARAAARAALSEKLGFHIGHPDRLSDGKALEDAKATLEDASAIEAPGPRLKEKTAALRALVAQYSTPVQIVLLSDNETEVVVYRVGKIGKFDRHQLVLRPGTYTVVGTRKGYRDVRVKLVVATDRPPEPIVVRCEEKI